MVGSGAIADVNALLAGVTFTPALNYNSGFAIATSVDDGGGPPITGTKNMTGTAVNAAPTARNVGRGGELHGGHGAESDRHRRDRRR